MQYAKLTKITLKEDWPVAMSSSVYGANLNTVGFNMDFITSRNAGLAREILKLLEKARKLQPVRNEE